MTVGKWLYLVLFALVGTLLGAPVAAAPNRIHGVKVSQHGSTTVVEIAGDRAPNFTTFKQDAPRRVIVDVAECDLGSVPQRIAGDGSLVDRVTTTQYGRSPHGISRVIIGLTREAEYRVVTRGGSLFVHLNAGTGGLLVSAGVPIAPPRQQPQVTRSSQELDLPVGEEPEPDVEADAEHGAGERPSETPVEPETVAMVSAAPEPVVEARPEPPPPAPEPVAEAPAEEPAPEPVAEAPAEEPAPEPVAEAPAEEPVPAVEAVAETPAAEYEAEPPPPEQVIVTMAEEPAPEPVVVAMAEPPPPEPAPPARALRVAQEEGGEDVEEVEEVPVETIDEGSEVGEEGIPPPPAADESAGEEIPPPPAADESAGEEIPPPPPPPAADEAADEVPPPPPPPPVEERSSYSEVEERVEISGAMKDMSWVGFQQTSESSRVFVKTNAPVRYRVVEEGDNLVVLELENTRIPLRNNRRFLDTHFFDSAVTLITPREIEGVSRNVRIEIQVRNRVPFQAGQDDNMVFVNFERSR